MSGRTIQLMTDFLVDGIHSIHDGSGKIWRVVQSIDRAHSNAKYVQVYCESTPGVLVPIARFDGMIGAPHIVIRPDGTAYVEAGGRNKTIETGYTLDGFVPLTTTARLLALVTLLEKRIEALEGAG